MGYVAVLKIDANGAVEKYQEFASQQEAEAHVGRFLAAYPDAFVVESPGSHLWQWVFDPQTKAASLRQIAEPEPSYRELRAIAYRDQLGKEQGDYIKTLGDVLDVLIAQAEATRVAAGADRTPDFDTMLTKIVAIKSTIAKPEDA